MPTYTLYTALYHPGKVCYYGSDVITNSAYMKTIKADWNLEVSAKYIHQGKEEISTMYFMFDLDSAYKSLNTTSWMKLSNFVLSMQRSTKLGILEQS